MYEWWCLCAGRLRLRPSHFPAVRPLLPGGADPVLPGGPRHRRHHLHSGESKRKRTCKLLPSRCLLVTSPSCDSGAVHRVRREAARLQQVGLEALQDHPRGRRLVRAQQGAQGPDDLPQFLAARMDATRRRTRGNEVCVRACDREKHTLQNHLHRR